LSSYQAYPNAISSSQRLYWAYPIPLTPYSVDIETYSDSDENGALFDAFHVCDPASFVGMKGHDDGPALGEDSDRSMIVSDKNIAG
jgi:hypothetical protein